VARL